MTSLVKQLLYTTEGNLFLVTIIDGFRSINDSEKKELAKKLKTMFSVGGSVKNGKIIIQGDNRGLIMDELKRIGFKVKRVGG